jgi:hypothetical protein
MDNFRVSILRGDGVDEHLNFTLLDATESSTVEKVGCYGIADGGVNVFVVEDGFLNFQCTGGEALYASFDERARR